MNKVILTGNLAREPELRRTQDQKAVASSAIAVNRLSKNADGTRKVDFIPFTAFDQKAEFLSKYCKKGDRIEIVGRWENRDWTDGMGNKRHESEVIVETIDSFPKADKPKEEPKKELDEVDVNDDDLPF